MQAGETDAPGQERIERLSMDSLVLIYTHSAFLADEMICPWACNYSAYSELTIVDQAFCDKLAETIKELLARCVEASEKYYATTKNRQVTWAKQYYKNVKNAKLDLAQQDTSKWVIVKLSPDVDSKPNDSFAVKKKCAVGNAKARKSTRPLAGTPDMQDPSSGEHNESVTKTRKPKPVNILNCYYCGEEGHNARNCRAKAADAIKETKRSTVTCYNCNQEGHVARVCNAPAQVPEKTLGRDATGRIRNIRRPQNDRFDRRIDVTGNGEGILTCDREVRKGEVTRTGHII
jgi:hypothetical protein